MFPSSFQPLKGYRVVDLTQVLAGPYSTYQLGLLGAEVIKIENVDVGDWTRPDPANPDLDGIATGYLTQGGNKKSLSLNIKEPEGAAIVKKLIESADIFVENMRPGTVARLGFSYEDVKAINDRIIYCSISAYGQDGPLSKRAAYDHVVQGMCGIMTTTGTPESLPNKVGAPYIDYATGLNAAFAILAAVMQAKSDGQSHRVDVSMLDSAMMLMSSMVCDTATVDTDHGAYGNEAFSRSPSSGAFETTDGTLMIAANNDRQFQNMCAALGRSDILSDERWAEPANRRANKDSLRQAIEQTIAGNSADHWEQKFEDHGVPAARVRTVHEVVNGPHLKARGIVQMMDMPGLSHQVGLPTIGFKADSENIGPTVAPPRLGADTADVLAELGMDQSEIDRLVDKGVVRCA